MAKNTRVRLVPLLAFLLATAALAPGRARADVQADVQAELEKAQKLYAAENYQEACRAYQRADELAQGKSVRVLKEQPYGLTESAVKAVKGWKFKPATLDGKPVTVYYVLTVNFQTGG